MAKDWKQPKPTEGERAKAASDEKKMIARNKRARHDLEIEDTLEAGIALAGTEVKACAEILRLHLIRYGTRDIPKFITAYTETDIRTGCQIRFDDR